VSDPSVIAQLVDLPEQYVPEWGFAVVGYLDEEGESRFETSMYGEQRATTLMGVLELMKHELVMISMAKYEDDEDEED
jgi:exosome complex RNA-binding protein Rrp4